MAVHAGDLLKEATIIFITSTVVWSQIKQQGGNRLHPSTENWSKRTVVFILYYSVHKISENSRLSIAMCSVLLTSTLTTVLVQSIFSRGKFFFISQTHLSPGSTYLITDEKMQTVPAEALLCHGFLLLGTHRGTSKLL